MCPRALRACLTERGHREQLKTRSRCAAAAFLPRRVVRQATARAPCPPRSGVTSCSTRLALALAMPMQQLALGAAASLFVVLPVGYLLRRFPAPGTPLGAQLVAAAAYASALLVTALVPLDVYLLLPAPSRDGEKAASQARDALAVAWNLAYWTAVGATVVLPLVQVRSVASLAACLSTDASAGLLRQL